MTQQEALRIVLEAASDHADEIEVMVNQKWIGEKTSHNMLESVKQIRRALQTFHAHDVPPVVRLEHKGRVG